MERRRAREATDRLVDYAAASSRTAIAALTIHRCTAATRAGREDRSDGHEHEKRAEVFQTATEDDDVPVARANEDALAVDVVRERAVEPAAARLRLGDLRARRVTVWPAFAHLAVEHADSVPLVARRTPTRARSPRIVRSKKPLE